MFGTQLIEAVYEWRSILSELVFTWRFLREFFFIIIEDLKYFIRIENLDYYI